MAKIPTGMEEPSDKERDAVLAAVRTGNPLPTGFAFDGVTVWKYDAATKKARDAAAAAEVEASDKLDELDAELIAANAASELIATAPRNPRGGGGPPATGG